MRCQGLRVVIGRGLDCDVMINSTRASRHHLALLFMDGRWMARDLDSANGTFLNRHRLTSAADIRAGDVLRFGEQGPKIRVVALDPAPVRESLRIEPTEHTTSFADLQETEPDKELTESSTW